MKYCIVIIGILICAVGAYALYTYGRSLWYSFYLNARGGRTTEQVIRKIEGSVRERLKASLEQAGTEGSIARV